MVPARPVPETPTTLDLPHRLKRGASQHEWIWFATGIAVLFFLLGLPFLGKTGLHYDASAELACFYASSPPVYQVTVFGHQAPLMVLQYLGTLKAWLYLPILEFLEVTPVVLRLPLLMCGGISVWLFFAILHRVAGIRSAIVGALLLATDVTFLVATSYDFGPIALLHLLLLAGIFLLLRFDETQRSRYLALAFLLFGLALWHKALFSWMFGGLVVASLVVFPKRVLARFTVRRAGIAAASLFVGASPLLYYNAVTGGATLHTGNVMSGAAPMAQKILILKKTLNGSVLFGWLTEDADPQTAVSPAGLTGRISARLTRFTGERRSDWMLYAFLAALCLVPWLWFTRARTAALFAVVYLIVTWAQMAAVPNTGATMHHVILLWPFPQFLVAIAFGELLARLKRTYSYVLTACMVAILGANLVVMNSLYTDLVTRGTTVIWTDAVYPLFHYLDSVDAPAVATVDWGYSATLSLLSDGEMPIRDVSYSLLQPSGDDAAGIRSLMSQPGTLFVDHVADGEQFPGVHDHLGQIAAQAGYTKKVVNLISDRNARPRFEISQYVRGN